MLFRLFIFSILALIFSSLFFAPTFAECPKGENITAIQFLKGCSEDASEGAAGVGFSEGKDGVKELVVNVAKVALQFAALFAVGAIVFSGIRYTTAYGDDEKVKKAKTTAIYALIGLVLTLTAFPLVDILVNFIYTVGT